MAAGILEEAKAVEPFRSNTFFTQNQHQNIKNYRSRIHSRWNSNVPEPAANGNERVLCWMRARWQRIVRLATGAEGMQVRRPEQKSSNQARGSSAAGFARSILRR